jgi:hypothetical protein
MFKRAIIITFFLFLAGLHFACVQGKNDGLPSPTGIPAGVQGGTEFGNPGDDPEQGGTEFGNPGDPGVQGGTEYGNPSVTGQVPLTPHSSTDGEADNCAVDTVRAIDVVTEDQHETTIDQDTCRFDLPLVADHTYIVEFYRDEELIATYTANVVVGAEGNDLGLILFEINDREVARATTYERPPPPASPPARPPIPAPTDQPVEVSGTYVEGYSTGFCSIFAGSTLNAIYLTLMGDGRLKADFRLSCPATKQGTLSGEYHEEADSVLVGNQISCDNKVWNISCTVDHQKLNEGLFQAYCNLSLPREGTLQFCNVANFRKN